MRLVLTRYGTRYVCVRGHEHVVERAARQCEQPTRRELWTRPLSEVKASSSRVSS